MGLNHVKFLLERGADPTIPDLRGLMPLHYYCMLSPFSFHSTLNQADFPNKDMDIQAVKLLMEYGADINAVGGNGETALELCI